ncbi:unnamed protein product [Gordionus sp. m RMFG-2023]
MGLIFTKFKHKSSIEILENIDKDIKELNEIRDFNMLKFKKYYLKILFFASLIMIIGLISFYLYLPSKWEARLYFSCILFSIPFVVWVLKNVLKLYYEKCKANSDIKIKQLLKQKNDILNNVKETETYKNAIEILNKFDQHIITNKQENSLLNIDNDNLKLRNKIKSSNLEEIENHNSRLRNNSHKSISSNLEEIENKNVRLRNNANKSISNVIEEIEKTPMVNGRDHNILRYVQNNSASDVQPKTPRPILPASVVISKRLAFDKDARLKFQNSKSYADKLLEYIIGDGNPTYRYALICSECFCHNGMAMKEEYEFLAFKCAYCSHFNHAKKNKPKVQLTPEDSPKENHVKALTFKENGD